MSFNPTEQWCKTVLIQISGQGVDRADVTAIVIHMISRYYSLLHVTTRYYIVYLSNKNGS